MAITRLRLLTMSTDQFREIERNANSTEPIEDRTAWIEEALQSFTKLLLEIKALSNKVQELEERDDDW